MMKATHHTTQNGGPPLVSIVILYYKRPEIIEETLRSALCQDYTNFEIIIVDNNSQDGLRDIVTRLSPEVRLIELSGNMGACGGRNAGIRAAAGEIIVFIDDDVTFASTRELSSIVDTFEQRPDFHVLAFQIWDPRTNQPRIREWCHTRPLKQFVDQEFETDWFGEGMCAFRREVLDLCGLYYEPLFYGAEGHDMVLRLMDRGYRMLYTPHIRVNHWASLTGRTHYRQYYYFTRAFIWMAGKDYPYWAGIRFGVPKVLMMLYFAWRSSAYGPVLRGIWDGVTGLRRLRPDRTPVSRSTLKRIAEYDRWRPGLFERLARHRAEPQI